MSQILPSRCLRYAAVGALLSLGAPLGLLALRAASGPGPSRDWLVAELGQQAGTYAYVLFSTLAAFCGFGYLVGRQTDRLQELARTDPLTGLLNRRAFEARLSEEFARAVRYKQPLSVLVLDLDGLKGLNDREGHRRGDAALVGAALALRRGSRATDIGARWGGDEFVVLAPSTAGEEALRLAERIRGAASASPQLAGLTLSAGVTTLEPTRPNVGPEALVADADAALYRAKQLGRNRVVSG